MPNLLSVIGSGLQGMQAGQDRARTAQQASQLFRSLGSQEATAFADLLTQDPRGAADVVEAFGGWQQLYSNLATNALNAEKIGLDQQQVEQGARGLELEERGLEQQAEIARSNMDLRREELKQNARLSEADLAVRSEMLEFRRQKAALDAVLKDQPTLKDERNLSNDFTAEVKKPREEIALAKRGLEFLESDDAISDISSMYAFLKAIDSASVVRPGEIELFRQALSAAEKTALGVRGLISPKLLPDRVRDQLKSALRKLRDEGMMRIDTTETQRMEQFTTLGVDPERARSLMIGRLTDAERKALGEGAGQPLPEMDLGTASDEDIAAAILRAQGNAD
jgi:hypothetical protein